jgi:drug/metabolite transporter (DMT)-like permease
VVLGGLAMLVSPLASAAASVAVKRWGFGIHPFSLAAVPMLAASLALGTVAWVTEREREVVWDPRSIAALVYLAIFGSVVAFSLYYRLLAHMPAKRLALITYIVPVVAMSIGLLRGEPLTLRTIVGSALVIVGVAVAVR